MAASWRAQMEVSDSRPPPPPRLWLAGPDTGEARAVPLPAARQLRRVRSAAPDRPAGEFVDGPAKFSQQGGMIAIYCPRE
ncbi:unnamed protein product [Lampetra planeri]